MPQRYRRDLHLSSKDAELAPEQHGGLANSCKCWSLESGGITKAGRMLLPVDLAEQIS